MPEPGAACARIHVYRRPASVVGSRLGSHIAGDQRDPSSRPRDGYRPVIGPSPEERRKMQAAGRKRLAFCANVQKRTRGKPPKPCVEIVMNGPPAFAHPDSDDWSEARNLAWLRPSLQHAKECLGPGSGITDWALHQDESSPHIHVIAVVADEEGHAGYNRIRHRFGITGKERYDEIGTAMQTKYARAVGLPRGRTGPPIRYAPGPKDRRKAEESRVIELERKRARAQADRDEAQARYDALLREKEARQAREEEVRRARAEEADRRARVAAQKQAREEADRRVREDAAALAKMRERGSIDPPSMPDRGGGYPRPGAAPSGRPGMFPSHGGPGSGYER